VASNEKSAPKSKIVLLCAILQFLMLVFALRDSDWVGMIGNEWGSTLLNSCPLRRDSSQLSSSGRAEERDASRRFKCVQVQYLGRLCLNVAFQHGKDEYCGYSLDAFTNQRIDQ
jgi:hypothetical protein